MYPEPAASAAIATPDSRTTIALTPVKLESTYRRKTNMTTLRCMALVSLGIAFCIGCGDSSTQSWEGSKSQPSADKKTAKVDDTANNDDTAPRRVRQSAQDDQPAWRDEPAWRHADARRRQRCQAGEQRQARPRYGPFHRAEIVDSARPTSPMSAGGVRHPEGRRRQGGRTSHREPGRRHRWKTTSIAGKGSSARSRTRRTRKPSTPAGSRSRSSISPARSTTRAAHDGRRR